MSIKAITCKGRETVSKIHTLEEVGDSSSFVDSWFPEWMLNFMRDNQINRYQQEGMSDLVLHHADHALLTAAEYAQAKRLLSQLKAKMQVRIGHDQLREMFKLVNMLVANPLPQNIFEFKIQAIYSVFQSCPAFLFNEQTCHRLAVLSSFFPSAHEINMVLKQELDRFTLRLEQLEIMVTRGFRTERQSSDPMGKPPVIQEAGRTGGNDDLLTLSHWQQTKRILSPIDQFLERLERLVEAYVPKKGHALKGTELRQALQIMADEIHDESLKHILLEKIHAVESAQRQLAELRRLQILDQD